MRLKMGLLVIFERFDMIEVSSVMQTRTAAKFVKLKVKVSSMLMGSMWRMNLSKRKNTIRART